MGAYEATLFEDALHRLLQSVIDGFGVGTLALRQQSRWRAASQHKWRLGCLQAPLLPDGTLLDSLRRCRSTLKCTFPAFLLSASIHLQRKAEMPLSSRSVSNRLPTSLAS